VSDDDRQKRRLGDATRDRIAGLADGWSVPGQPGDKKDEKPRALTDAGEAVATTPFERETFENAAPTTVAPSPVLPPPPPGSKRPTMPPPIPPRRPVVEERVEDRADDRPEDRDDATTVEPPSRATPAAAQAHMVAGLRDAPRFARRKGLVGDLRYVFTAWFGVRRARRELVTVDAEITSQKTARATRLADLGRAAISDDRFDQTAVRTSRDQLMDLEDVRSRHAGAAAAADAELDAIERARTSELNRLGGEIEVAEAEIVRLDAELAPLERDAAAARKRAGKVKETLASIDARVAAAKASLVSVKGPKHDPVAIEADLATLSADRQAVARDEPAIVAELDGLLPRIASLQAARSDAQARITAARAGEIEATSRAVEQVAAVQARRRVEDRAAAAARTAGDKALVELGERLYSERPDDLTIALKSVERQDLELATVQRRGIELRELVGSVERGAVARGIFWWLLILLAVAAAVVVALRYA